MTDTRQLPRTFRFASFEVDLKSRELSKDGIKVAVQEKPFRLLEALVLARGDVVSRVELASALWPGCRHVEAEMGINTAVRKLRHSLGDSARKPSFVETVPRVGYRLLAPVEFSDTALSRITIVADARETAAQSLFDRFRRPAAYIAAGLALTVALVVWASRPAPELTEIPIPEVGATAPARPLPKAEPVRRQYLAALHLKARGTPQAAEKAARLFEEVTRQEPEFDPAHGELAMSLVHRAVFNRAECGSCEQRARQAVNRTLQRSPELAEARLADAVLAIHFDWDWDRARRALQRAAELDPDIPETHLVMATWMVIMARYEEALIHVRRAVELDPGSFLVRSDAGFFYLAAGRDDDAAAECRMALEVDPGFLPARKCLLLASARLGAFEEAWRHARALMVEQGASLQELAALDAAASGERLQVFWRWNLRRLEAASPAASPISLASVFAQLGQPREALAWLERAYDRRHPEVVFLNLFAELSPLRRLPEYESLIERLTLADGDMPPGV